MEKSTDETEIGEDGKAGVKGLGAWRVSPTEPTQLQLAFKPLRVC